MLKQIPTLITLKSYLSVFQLVSKFIKNEQIRQAFSIQPLLLEETLLKQHQFIILFTFWKENGEFIMQWVEQVK